jgi:hypothetical protein
VASSEGIAVSGTAPAAGAASGHDEGALTLAVGTAILMMAIIQIGLVMKGNAPVLDGVLIDPDGYMRLARVAQLWQDGNWFACCCSARCSPARCSASRPRCSGGARSWARCSRLAP